MKATHHVTHTHQELYRNTIEEYHHDMKTTHFNTMMSEARWLMICVNGYVTACDPGCNNISSYCGYILLNKATVGMNLKTLVSNKWWNSSIAHRFSTLTLKEVNNNSITIEYGTQTLTITQNESKHLDHVPLDYAYADIYIELRYDLYKKSHY